jgi:CubicO group peptidase (beta-lactamase class C family)
MTALPRAKPSEVGVPAEAVRSFLKDAVRSGQELHSLMIVKSGAVIAEGWWHPYRRQDPHILFSLSKSFASTAAGFAVSEGRFTLDDAVLDFFPEQGPREPGANLRAMRVRHLLSMSVGHDSESLGPAMRDATVDWRDLFLNHPVPFVPGEHFLYNSMATFMVSAIVQKTTGQRLLDYLSPRLLQPLGIVGATWEQNAAGIDVGGWGLSVKTEDIAKFGLLYLNDGLWNGSPILPEGWAKEATKKHVSNGSDPNNDWNQGYGFQFWRCRHGAVRGDGAFGQYCVVMPNQDAVVAITGTVSDMGAVLNALWDHLLPSLNAGQGDGSDDLLAQELAHLALATPDARGEAVAGMFSGRYVFEEPEAIRKELSVEFGPEADSFVWSSDHGAERWVAGRGSWRAAEKDGSRTVAAGNWQSSDRYLLHVRDALGTYGEDIEMVFNPDGVRVTHRTQGAFWAADNTEMVGRRG